jgi:hypothetical protein
VNKEASHYVGLFGGNKIGNHIFWLPRRYNSTFSLEPPPLPTEASHPVPSAAAKCLLSRNKRNSLATHSVTDSLNLLSYPGSSSGFVVHKNSYIYLGPTYESTSGFFCYVLQLLLTSASRDIESITITQIYHVFEVYFYEPRSFLWDEWDALHTYNDKSDTDTIKMQTHGSSTAECAAATVHYAYRPCIITLCGHNSFISFFPHPTLSHSTPPHCQSLGKRREVGEPSCMYSYDGKFVK